uniref:Hermansky-Pudlak syndrome 4 protein isoform X2 n=1 Tax=Geotrypetes seraphini TaxID=260995 RepID=A0A6P8RZU2_GEOSA|nr:Hermansky-Pudlak syndrome 4 protein isoform X2 [Geotrypetes seraphini]
MATSVLPEPVSASWLNYFFLYDGSKVKEEGDPTRVGICYFYPVQVLGCAVELADSSCIRFLDQLIGLFQFYNGPVRQAYQVIPQVELSKKWDLYLAHIQKDTGDLRKIFNSLWNLDKTKVDALLMLKAALILQTCQRSPYVLAGCIFYKGRIVSTQLPPPLTAKVLFQRDELVGKNESHRGNSFEEQNPKLPQDVVIVSVFITEDEATALRQFPVQWMTSSSRQSTERKSSRLSRTLSDVDETNQASKAQKTTNVEKANISENMTLHLAGSLMHPTILPEMDQKVDNPSNDASALEDAIVPETENPSPLKESLISKDELQGTETNIRPVENPNPLKETLISREALKGSETNVGPVENSHPLKESLISRDEFQGPESNVGPIENSHPLKEYLISRDEFQGPESNVGPVENSHPLKESLISRDEFQGPELNVGPVENPHSLKESFISREEFQSPELNVGPVENPNPLKESLIPRDELRGSKMNVQPIQNVSQQASPGYLQETRKSNCHNETRDCSSTVCNTDSRVASINDGDTDKSNELNSPQVPLNSFITCGSTDESDKSKQDCYGSSLKNESLDPSSLLQQSVLDKDPDHVDEKRLVLEKLLDEDGDQSAETFADSARGKDRFFSFTEDSSTEATDWPSAADSHSCAGTALVKMNLYIHTVKGLVLSLLAEEQFQHDPDSVQDVYHSSLASLNGLEVHLKETLPKDQTSSAKTAYTFAHYDCIQNVLTANLPETPSALDLHFLRAISLIHSDFSQLQTAHEITIRNASTAIFGCQNPVQETYFQQLASPVRNSGVPNPHDTAFSLPGKAKQKLLKHGVNLL